MDAIKVENAGKRIRGTWVLKDVTVSFEAGKIHGLIGRNGAGKTVLMKCICGMARLTEGAILVENKKIGVDVDIPESVGAIIEVPGFLPNLTGFANLKYLANLRNRITDTDIKGAMRMVGLFADDNKHVGKYSLGMRQRLGIAQAIMEDPNILLLDEPMNGLDNRGVRDMKDLFVKLRTEGKTILLASHHIEDITELCDTVCLLDSGRLERVEKGLTVNTDKKLVL